MTKFIVIEIQTAEGGIITTLPYAFDTMNEALAKYYAVLSTAAVSLVPIHTCILITNEGIMQKYESFNRIIEENNSL